MRRWREIVMTVAIIGGLAAYWIGSEVHYARSISPKGIATVQNFFERFGEPRRIRMVERDGKSYYEFTGQSSGSWSAAVPSSRPAYVFDEQGQFVTWCPDPGDAPSYRRTWPLQSTNPVEVGVVRRKFGL
ncbi:hypothetical protein ACXR0O_17425 [Verrucomicrobiota bacterium sgz303538]